MMPLRYSIQTFRLHYEYGIEYECDFLNLLRGADNISQHLVSRVSRSAGKQRKGVTVLGIN